MKLKKTCALVLSAALVVSALAGCSGKPTSASSPASQQAGSGNTANMNPIGKFPICKEKITVKALVGSNSNEAKDWNTLEAFKRLEKLTNIHWDFEYVDGSTAEAFTNQLSIRMAGDDLPEVAISQSMSSDTEEAYGPVGKLMDITPYLKYAPHLQKLFADNKTVRLSCTASDGKHYGLPNYTLSTANVPNLTFFQKKWMDKVGITKVPETTDELYAMLKAFKDKAPNGNPKTVIPMSCAGEGNLRIILQTAFQGYAGGSVTDEWDVDDNGKVVYLPEEKGYKEYLAYCNKLYKEGLLSNDFATIKGDQLKAENVSGNVGLYLGSTPTVLAGTKMENEPQICLGPLTSPTNSKKVAQTPHNLYPTNGVITSNCKHPEAVMSWFDLFYRPLGEEIDGFCGMTSLLGYENEQWKFTDAAKTKYQFIAPTKSYLDLNKNTMITFGMPCYINLTAFMQGSPLMTAKMEQNKEKYSQYYRASYPEGVRFTKEESDQTATIQTDLDNYQGMMATKFITGQENLSGFDKFVSNLKQYRCDTLKQLKQAAYDRYSK